MATLIEDLRESKPVSFDFYDVLDWRIRQGQSIRDALLERAEYGLPDDDYLDGQIQLDGQHIDVVFS